MTGGALDGADRLKKTENEDAVCAVSETLSLLGEKARKLSQIDTGETKIRDCESGAEMQPLSKICSHSDSSLCGAVLQSHFSSCSMQT